MSDLEITIDYINDEDITEVARLEKNCFSEPWSSENIKEALDTGNYVYLVAKDNNRLVGYCGVQMLYDEAELTNVAVDENYRGRGIGDKLLECIFEICRRNTKNVLFLEVRASNQPAINLYEKKGFITIGRRKNFYRFPSEDAILMSKNI